MMMGHMTYVSKSPEKSSPSFPEDIEDDDPIDVKPDSFTPCKITSNEYCDVENDQPPDVTMLAEDDYDEITQTRAFSLLIDSPRHPNDSSEKKVHWSNQNVQILLDCVEKHLDEFNVQKKHKQVWQTIGIEMEALGFTMEHCYNKWKNLRRDVRLLVNNPQKAVRNADILRRVARLILVIYPNIDATTMQMAGDRNGGKSAPVTPVGFNTPNCKVCLPSTFHAPDSPCFVSTGSYNSIYHISNSNGTKHRNPNRESYDSMPSTALFTNLGPGQEVQDCKDDSKLNSQTPDLPFVINPAAAAFIVQSQLFNDLLRQQQQQSNGVDSYGESSVTQEQPSGVCTTPKTSSESHSSSNTTRNIINGGGSHSSDSLQAVSLASTLLNGLASTDTATLPAISANGNDTQQLLDRLPPGSELAGVVERLRDEETIHIRITDMVTHIADELRAAGMRRRATLDQLLGIMQGSRFPSSLFHTSKATDAGNLH